MKTYNYHGHTELKRFIIRDREAGNYLEADFDTLEEALAQVSEWEREDEENNHGEQVTRMGRWAGFYEVFDLETEEIV